VVHAEEEPVVGWRVALVATSAALAGAFLYGHQFDISPPGVLYDIWYGSAFGWVLFGLLTVVGFAVRRWWALLVLGGPFIASVVLGVTGHQSPWEDAPAPLDTYWLYLMGFWILALGVPIAAGIGLGVLWERIRPGAAGGRAQTGGPAIG
jgi:hypothetical protein